MYFEWGDIFYDAIAAIIAFITLVYILSLIIKDASIIDIAWGFGFVVVAIVLLASADQISMPRGLVSLYVFLWGTRLGLHILTRKIGKPEDWRYQQWRKDWGKNFWWQSYFRIFLLQAGLMFIIAAPLYIISHNDNADVAESVFFTTIGSAIWWYGFLFESIGDWQLRQFLKSKPKKGAVMDQGFWKYTRHPNYFGEVTQWWGLWIIVLPLSGGWAAIISPIMITFLLLKVSGITMLEKKYDKNKAYQDYKKRTSAFIPLPPKKPSK